jgi:hypothetical protein
MRISMQLMKIVYQWERRYFRTQNVQKDVAHG